MQTTEPYFTSDYGHDEQSSVAAPTPADPLDAATVTAEDHEDEQSASHDDAHPDTTASRTPGFSMFTSSVEDESEAAVQRESVLGLHDDLSEAGIGNAAVAVADDDLPYELHAEESASLLLPASPLELVSSSSSSSPERAIVSPLDQQSPSSNVERAFSSLALGGESQGGWQAGWGGYEPAASTMAFSAPSTAPSNNDEEDDDDTPIGQTARFRNAGSPQASILLCIVVRGSLTSFGHTAVWIACSVQA